MKKDYIGYEALGKNKSRHFMKNEITRRKKSWFFVLCRKLGYNINLAKDRAKKKFRLESFSDIQEHQLNYLIDILLTEQDKECE